MATTEKAPAPTAKDKKSSIQKQIEALQAQMQELAQSEIHELKLKLSDARKVVSNLEAELEALTGKPSSPQVRTRRPRTPSIQDDALKDQLIKMMTAFGADGMNAKQIAEKLHQDPIRVRKFIKDNQKVMRREGAGPGTKFYLA